MKSNLFLPSPISPLPFLRSKYHSACLWSEKLKAYTLCICLTSSGDNKFLINENASSKFCGGADAGGIEAAGVGAAGFDAAVLSKPTFYFSLNSHSRND